MYVCVRERERKERERKRYFGQVRYTVLSGKCPQKVEPLGTIPIIAQSKSQLRKARR